MEPLTGRTPRDQNRVPALFAIDTTTGNTTVPLEANPATGALLVENVSGGGISANIAQFGGNNIVTGTGTSGLGIPRVTVSNDSNILATQSGTWTVTDNTTNANLLTGQQTVNTTQVQVTASSNTLVNGMRLKALSSNAANIYFGLTGVTTTTGDTLEPGESGVLPISNTNLLYIISVASTTDKVSWSGS